VTMIYPFETFCCSPQSVSISHHTITNSFSHETLF
jgi:hypothetical protein